MANELQFILDTPVAYGAAAAAAACDAACRHHHRLGGD